VGGRCGREEVEDDVSEPQRLVAVGEVPGGREEIQAASGGGVVRAGGVLGGISSGQDIIVSMALKPTSSISSPGQTVDVNGNPIEVSTTGRHDPCVGLRATPIAEAMLALVLMDHALRHRAQNMDVVCTTPVITAKKR